MLKRREAWCAAVVVGLLGLGGCASTPSDDATLLTSRSEARAKVPGGTTQRMDRAGAWTQPLTVGLTRSDGYLLVPTDINHQPAGLMMIDTGASLSVVSLGTAGRLMLNTDGAGKTVGIGGVQEFQYHRIGSLTIGDGAPTSAGPTSRVQLTPTRLAGLELSNFGRALGVGLTGIVGFTDLADVPFTLDTQAQQLTLHPPISFRPPRGAQRQRMTLFRRLPTVEAELDDGRQRVKVRLLIDYGADTALTLPTQLLEQYPGLVAVDAAGVGSTQGVGGHVQSTQTWVRQVRVFGLNLQHIPVNFETPPQQLANPTPGNPNELPMGRVGNSLLKHFRLTFHASHGWLYTQWLPDAQ